MPPRPNTRRPRTTPRRRTPAAARPAFRPPNSTDEKDKELPHGEAMDQLLPAGKDGRQDACRNGTLRAGRHAATGIFGGARARAGGVLVLRELLEQPVPQRR